MILFVWLFVDGTHDSLVPYPQAELFWQRLKEKRKEWEAVHDEEPVRDVFVGLPYARHAFNAIASPMSPPLADSKLLFTKHCFEGVRSKL